MVIDGTLIIQQGMLEDKIDKILSLPYNERIKYHQELEDLEEELDRVLDLRDILESD